MDKKILIYGAVIVVVLVLLLASLGIIKFGSSSGGSSSSSSSSISSGDMPEKCKVGQGYDLQSWKEHLGHHAETKPCLDYYK